MLHTKRAPTAARGLVMTSFRLGSLTVGLLALLATCASAQTWFVDSSVGSCSGTAAGTEADPYCTIAQAMAAHKGPGVTLVVKPGVYREQVTVPVAGAPGLPFVLRASGPGVLLDGSDDFANAALWTPSLGTSFLAASVTWNAKQVFVEGARLVVTTATPVLMPANSFRWVAGEGLYVNLGGDNPGARKTAVGRRNHGFNMFTKSFVNIEGFEVTRTEDRGINIQNGCADLAILNNRVSFANSYGIHTVNGQRILIHGNVVSDCNFHGIGLTAGASGCTVSANESFRNAHLTIRQANGIYLLGAPGNTIVGNQVHHNEDTGLHFATGANKCVSVHNRSWSNGDHGFDHLGAIGVAHVNDVAYANFIDGFSFEGGATDGSVFNCIAVENGLANDGSDLWVDAGSALGFSSDHNILWNSTLQEPIRYGATRYASLADFTLATGHDAHSRQADPLFVNPGAGEFAVRFGSPAIDAAHTGVANWPAADILGTAPVDDFRTADTGEGTVSFADIGVGEFLPPDAAPVVKSPANVNAIFGTLVTFNVTASDPDGDAIQSLTMRPVRMPANHGAQFFPNSTNTGGRFVWPTLGFSGIFRVEFVAANTLQGSSGTNIKVRGRLASEPAEPAVTRLALSNGFPNPSGGAVAFALDLPEDSDVDLSVYDMQGRRVWSESRTLAAGRNSVRWDGLTSSRRRAETGIYFLRARVGSAEFVRRVVRF